MKISSINAYFEIDEEDFDKLSKMKWGINKYNFISGCYKSKKHLIHRYIMNVTDKNIKVDHIDGNRCNNKKENLRLCSNKENNTNTSVRSTNKSGFKGVCWEKRIKKWRVTLTHNSKQIHIGTFTDIIEAAKAYDKKAKELFGDFAWLNFRNKNESHLQHY